MRLVKYLSRDASASVASMTFCISAIVAGSMRGYLQLHPHVSIAVPLVGLLSLAMILFSTIVLYLNMYAQIVNRINDYLATLATGYLIWQVVRYCYPPQTLQERFMPLRQLWLNEHKRALRQRDLLEIKNISLRYHWYIIATIVSDIKNWLRK